MFGRVKELNPFYGKKHTEETKRKISEKNSGEKHCFYGKKRNLEYIKKISGQNHYNFGKKCERTSLMNKKRIGLLNPVAKTLLDYNTGVFYYSANDYCVINNISNSTFRYKYKTNKLKNILFV